MKKNSGIIASLIFVSLAAQGNSFQENLSRIDQNLLRGSMPRKEDISTLKSLGVKTILSLQSTPNVIEKERKWAIANGIKLISIPMSSLFFIRPSQELTNKILEIESDPRNYPLFVHCRHGKDRTGFAIGLYRVFQESWRPESAFEEMKEFGYKSGINIGLNCAFWERTGMNYPNSCNHVAPWEE